MGSEMCIRDRSNTYANKVFLVTAYPQSEIVGTMKRLLACLALCASISASAQDDNCTVLGVQELSSLYSELSTSIDTIVTALSELQLSQPTIEDVYICSSFSGNSNVAATGMSNCINDKISEGYTLHGNLIMQIGYLGTSSYGYKHYEQLMVKYADD